MALTRNGKRTSKQKSAPRKPDVKRIDQVTALLHQLDSARDQEHKLLARELHDTLVASLSATKLECDWLLRAQPSSEAHKQRLSRMSASLTDAIQFTRGVIDELWPVAVQHLGLVAALEAQLRAIDPAFANAKLSGDLDTLPEAHALTLYRAVLDVVKRQATSPSSPLRVELAIRRTVKGVDLRLDLRGGGRESTPPSPSNGGLTRERVVYLGGEYLLADDDRGGVRLRLFLPVTPPLVDLHTSGAHAPDV